MNKTLTLTRTGDSNWYIKNTAFNDTPEQASKWIISLKCDSDEISNIR